MEEIQENPKKAAIFRQNAYGLSQRTANFMKVKVVRCMFANANSFDDAVNFPPRFIKF